MPSAKCCPFRLGLNVLRPISHEELEISTRNMEFEKHTCKIIATSLRGQWVKAIPIQQYAKWPEYAPVRPGPGINMITQLISGPPDIYNHNAVVQVSVLSEHMQLELCGLICLGTWMLSAHLTHWCWGKMDAILQMTFSNAFSWMKIYEFCLRLDWILFLGFELTIFQHWFR